MSLCKVIQIIIRYDCTQLNLQQMFYIYLFLAFIEEVHKLTKHSLELDKFNFAF